jgi:hypothetical protein
MAPVLAALAAALLWQPGSIRAQETTAGDLHLLVSVQGAVALRRAGWSMATPIGPGAALRRGDLVSVPRQGRATVACADLTLQELPAGRFSGIPCAVPKQTALVYEGSLLAATRGDEADEVPIVIAPRRTRLLSPRPVLRWSVPPGAGSVTVAVRGAGVAWSTQPPAGTASLTYPADAPALQPDATYRVTVTAGARSSDEAAEPGSGFSLLTGPAADEARAGVDRIGALGLGADAKRLLVAHFLASRGLVAEAIEQLEAAAPAARPLLTLGSLYQSVGLARLAEARNLQAAKAAAAAGDVEAQAQAQLALGTLYLEVFGLREDAARAYGDAATLFARVGDGAAAERARERSAHAKGS